MAQQYPNDPIYAPGDVVRVYATGGLAALALAGQLANDGHPRPAVVVREHPSEPGMLEVAYQDGQAPTSELITDQQRLRHAAV
jgi:hypothetical protein